MRKSKLTAEEIEDQELTEYTRQYKRNKTQTLVNVRDRGWVNLSNGVALLWHSNAPLEEGGVRQCVPQGYFVLVKDGEAKMFDVDEFRKYLRWA